MERRRYWRKQYIRAAMMDQEEASQEQHQTGGKSDVRFTPAQERTPTMLAPTTSIHSVPMLGSLYESCRFIAKNNVSERTQEAALVPTAAGSVTQGTRDRDHVLLSVTAVIKGTPVRALVDSGATRSFVNEKLQLCPPLSFIGAYSSLEMANGDTIVSTGIAPAVLVCIGKVQFRSDLEAVPLMKGYDVVLGKDWLDMVNPLIDWCSNCMYIRQGDQLHVGLGDPMCSLARSRIEDYPVSETVSLSTTIRDYRPSVWKMGCSYLCSWHPLSFGNTKPVSASGQLNNPRGRYTRRIQFKTTFSLTPGLARPK